MLTNGRALFQSRIFNLLRNFCMRLSRIVSYQNILLRKHQNRLSHNRILQRTNCPIINRRNGQTVQWQNVVIGKLSYNNKTLQWPNSPRMLWYTNPCYTNPCRTLQRPNCRTTNCRNGFLRRVLLTFILSEKFLPSSLIIIAAKEKKIKSWPFKLREETCVK